jgi:hypothetical protein
MTSNLPTDPIDIAKRIQELCQQSDEVNTRLTAICDELRYFRSQVILPFLLKHAEFHFVNYGALEIQLKSERWEELLIMLGYSDYITVDHFHLDLQLEGGYQFYGDKAYKQLSFARPKSDSADDSIFIPEDFFIAKCKAIGIRNVDFTKKSNDVELCVLQKMAEAKEVIEIACKFKKQFS